MAHKNPLVEFLRHYGPIAAQDNMYDERIGDALKTYGVAPIVVQPAKLESLLLNFRSGEPTTTILTGTAGDGKTFHCRRVFEELGGERRVWTRGTKRVSVSLPGRAGELVIIKDLSELTDDDKRVLLPDVGCTVRGEEKSRCYLIAANDGQLLATWRRWGSISGEEQEIFRALESMLVNDEEEHETLKIRMYNLSRSALAPLFDDLLEGVISHPDWSRCGGCPVANEEGETPLCPILVNRERLARNGQWRLRSRLGELIELAAANDQHLPIRHLLLLVVNILLGDAKSRNPLLTCLRAQRRASDGDYRNTNPYANVFGGNLGTGKRSQYLAFSALASFGIGQETENDVDDLLVFGPYEAEERFQRLVAADERFGDPIYRWARENYLEGDRRQMREFLRSLEAQRQRFFFELPQPGDESDIDPWRLTVFRHAGQYLDFRRFLRENGGGSLPSLSLLARGLNRTFSGMMIDTSSEVYLATGGGDGRARVARFLARDEVCVGRPDYRPYLVFDWPSGRPHPRIAVLSKLRGDKSIAEIDLRLTHFEYLMRVASGSLPASFSRQCFEDFHGFKLRLLEELKLLDAEAELPMVLDEGRIDLIALRVGESGNVEKTRVSIGVPRHDH
jgi:hypothetical protein